MNTLRFFFKGIAKVSLFCLGVAICSCNALKRVGDNQLLLTKNKLRVDGEKVSDEDIKGFILQEPNSTVLGFPLRLHLYNLAKKDPDSSYQAWLHRKEKREQRLINLLSEKQVERLGESFMVKGMSVWLKKIGEAPAIVDTARASKSADRLKGYYDTKGYFNNQADFTIEPTKRKQRAQIDYEVDLGPRYKVDSLTRDISSHAVDSLYTIHKDSSFVKEGKHFDLLDFNNERQRLTSLFRNSGIYNFQESSITYDIVRDTLTDHGDQGMDVELHIADPRERNGDSTSTQPYKVYRFGEVNIYPDYSFGTDKDSLKLVQYDNYNIYYKDKLRYKPKALTNAVFLQKDSIYRDLDRIRTYRQISNLNTFKYPSIEFLADSTDTKLIGNVYLAARPKYSLGTEFNVTHSNIQPLGLSFSSSLITRNLFKGTETLSLSARGTFGLLGDRSISEDYFSEVGGDISLTIPRIWTPFFKSGSIIPNYMLPQTRITAGSSFQKNIGLDKQTFNSILGYNWSPDDFRKNMVELLNVQFVRNVNPNRFFNVYQNSYSRLDGIADAYQDDPNLAAYYETPEGSTEPRLIIPEGTQGFTQEVLDNGLIPANTDDYQEVRSIEERRQRLTENNLIFATNYTFTKNNKLGINDLDFYQLRFKLESAGNLLSLISQAIPFNQSDGKDLVFGVPYSQYVKAEVNYIKHWDLSHSNILAFRTFFGLAVPYGNSESVPFVRSYFAGGSNDNRGWNPYSLGPGRTEDVNDFNEANLKLAFNLEYRFPIVGSVKGALFADAGNIWNIWDNVTNEDAVFNGFDSLSEIALGTGLGLRYDFTYFVFRLDLGFKTYNPALEPSKRWFSQYNLSNAVFNIGINYPF